MSEENLFYALREQPRSLISAFFVRCLDSILSIVSLFAISWLSLICVAELGGVIRTWSHENRFFVTRLINGIKRHAHVDISLFKEGRHRTELKLINQNVMGKHKGGQK